MKVDVVNIENKPVEKIELPDKIFAVKWNPNLIHQVLTVQISNGRKNLAHVKDRSEVRGGGRKPWRQKHTGKARHSSTRSPLWAGGGVTFGPRNTESFSRKINKKAKKAALFSVLSRKLKDNEIFILDKFALKDHKTKNIANILKNFIKKTTSVLLIPTPENKNVVLAGRNINKAVVLKPESLNVYDCLSNKFILFDKESVAQFIKYFEK